MKIRDGFVSNSSSSSFIVAFPRKPETVEELQKMLFGDCLVYPHPYDSDEYYSTKTVANTVFGDIVETEVSYNESRRYGEMLSSIRDSGMNGCYDRPEFMEEFCKNDPSPMWPDLPEHVSESEMSYEEQRKLPRYVEYYKLQEKYNMDHNAWQKRCLDTFVVKHPGYHAKFTYSDDEGSYFCALEHGNLFRKLPHIWISNH